MWAKWITHKHTVEETTHLMRLSGLYLWFSTSDFWKFRCVARWFWLIIRGELLRNPFWFSAVRTKAIDYGENKDHLAVLEFNSLGALSRGNSWVYCLTEKRKKENVILSRKASIHTSHWGDELSLLFCTAWHFCLNSYHVNGNHCFNVNIPTMGIKACLVAYISTISKPKLVFWRKNVQKGTTYNRLFKRIL